jgi:hypothetical protein
MWLRRTIPVHIKIEMRRAVNSAPQETVRGVSHVAIIPVRKRVFPCVKYTVSCELSRIADDGGWAAPMRRVGDAEAAPSAVTAVS